MMDKEIIKEIAIQISNEAFLNNWKFYAITTALFLISYAIGNFLKAYMGKRGEQLARKSDLDKILRELKQTTETTESIKTKLDKDSWIQKEINLLRRQKLEELLCLLYEYKENVHKEVKESLIDNNQFSVDSTFSRITALHKLYFPDLNESMTKIYLSSASYGNWKSEALQQKINNQTENRLGLPNKEHLAQYKEKYTLITNAITAVEEQAKEIMGTLMSIS